MQICIASMQCFCSRVLLCTLVVEKLKLQMGGMDTFTFSNQEMSTFSALFSFLFFLEIRRLHTTEKGKH